jgi:dTDP-4-amino-4,6-dideoxygalactose transaminase
VVASGQVAQGPEVEALEREIAGRLGLPGGVAVSSGTSALYLALEALGIGPGDEVLVPDYACAALVHAVRMSGALPVPVDALPESGNMDPDDAKKRLTAKTRATVAVHLFGAPADVAALAALGPPVVEDCAQSPGARIGDIPAGALGAVSVFSFYATKALCAGEGGMVCSGRPEILARVRDARDYDNREDLTKRFNWKMTDMQAAMARVQLGRLDGFLAARERIARAYNADFSGLGLLLPKDAAGRIWYRYVLSAPSRPEAFIRAMDREGIAAARPVFKPLHRYLGLSGYPGAEECHGKFVSIPIYPSLTEEERGRVVAGVGKTVKGQCGRGEPD